MAKTEWGVPRFKVGDWVDASRWDATERAENRIGVVQVQEVLAPERSGSGVMIKVKGGRWLDQNWFQPANLEQLGFEI